MYRSSSQAAFLLQGCLYLQLEQGILLPLDFKVEFSRNYPELSSDLFQDYLDFLNNCSSPLEKDYRENHHILPVCLFPEYRNTKDNIVSLKAKDHFVAHFLLYKLSHPKLFWAWRCMWRGLKRRNLDPEFLQAYAEEYENAKLSWVMPEEIRQKIARSHIGILHSEETKAHLSAARSGIYNNRYGIPHTEETKLKITLGNRNRKWVESEESRKRRSENMKGRILPEETKRKIGEGNKGKTQSEKTKKLISEAHKGKPSHTRFTLWFHHPLTCQNKRAKIEEISVLESEGWVRGRIKWNQYAK